MSWFHKEETGNHSVDAMEAIHKWANNKPGYCNKFAASDMKSKKARAVVYYSDKNIPTSEKAPSSTTKWVLKHLKDSSYEKVNEQACLFLSNLTSYQQVYASVMLTNAGNNDPVSGVIYPEE